MKKLSFWIIIFLIPFNAFGYEVTVHRKIAEYAINASYIEQYLNNNLYISLDDIFRADIVNIKSGKDWISENF